MAFQAHKKVKVTQSVIDTFDPLAKTKGPETLRDVKRRLETLRDA